MIRQAVLIILAATIAACNGSNPIEPRGDVRTPLAGGGRLTDDDPFNGGPEDSGPLLPDSVVEPILPDAGLTPLFYSQTDCADSPGEIVIRDSAQWRTWWEAANSCLWYHHNGGPNGEVGPGHPNDSVWTDTSFVDSTMPCDPCIPEVPFVDFDHQVVVAIRIEPDSSSECMRSVWMHSVENGVVSYEVTSLAEDCCELMMRPFILESTSPVVAVAVPGPLSEPVIWLRRDTSHSCHWEPDPDEPLPLYYTDAPCDLGPHETVIRDAERWDAWVQSALTCDSIRWSQWGHGGDSANVPDDSIGMDPGEPTLPMSPFWWGPPVDFSTHAVIILRAGEQLRWGGGIWLDAFHAGQAGSTIEYTVMEPGEDCPVIDMDPSWINPTIAVRLPLPLADPINWTRHLESITCEWGQDSTWNQMEPGHP